MTWISSQSLQFFILSNHRRGLATPIFSLSSLEPKRLRMVILTIILVQVLCCLYQSPKHYIEIWHERPFSLHKVNISKDNMKSTRHVKRRLKSVRKLRNSRVIALDYVHTSKNLADQFTKDLSRNVIEGASREMGMRPT